MVIQHSNADTLQLKIGQTIVSARHDGSIKIADRALEGPGEYDVAGIGVHAFPTHALLFAEGVHVAIVWDGSSSLSSEDDASSDVFILLLEDAKQVESIIKEQDPRVVILHNESVSSQIALSSGTEIQSVSNYKVTAQTLPAENRDIVLLG